MREKGLIVLLCSLLMVFQPAFGAPSASPIGTVNGKGPIQLDGVAAPAGTDVYAGNRIATGSGASGYITLAHGSKLVLGASTGARITERANGFAVNLDHGVIGAISAEKAPIVVMAGGVTILTKKGSGTYEVALKGNTLRVLARRGTTLAEAASRNVEVPEGKLMKATVAPESTPPGKKKMILVALIAAGIAGASLGVALAEPSKKCVSPSALGCP